MPIVSRYGESQTTIAALRGGKRTAHATAESEGAYVESARADKFGALAGFGERIARTGAGIYARIVEEEREAADRTALLKASNQLSEWKNKRLYDAKAGALALKGEAALPLPETIRGEYDKVAGEIEATLSTDRQRAAFANLRTQEWQSVDLQVQRHVFGEMQAFRQGELKALVENSVNSAIAAAADPKLVAVELQKATSAIRINGPSLGLGTEAIAEQVRAVTTKTHLGVIGQLLAQENDRGAAAYFEATRDQIAGDKLDEVIKALDEGTLRGEAQRTSDTILRAGGSFAEQREKARAIEDPKLRDAVMQRIEHERIVSDRLEKERDEAALRSAYDILDKTPNITKIPPGLWSSFDGSQRSAMLSYARTRAKGEPVETNLGTYYQLMRGAMIDPQGFSTDNLLKYRHQLDEGDFKQLTGLQLSIRNADTKAAEKDLAPFRTRQQLLDDTLTQHGIDPNAKADTSEGKSIAQLRRMVDLRVELLQAGGKKATNQDIQGEIDRLLAVKETVPGSWWNIFPGGKSFTDVDKRLMDMTIADIPAAERAQIEAALRARNRPISDATILDLYLEAKVRQRR